LTGESHKPSLVAHPAGTLSLSGNALLGLMQAVLARGLPFRFEARGTSMSPFIRDGDIVTIRPIGRIPPKKGDVVAFAEPLTDKLYVHRIIKETRAGFAIKGDNLPRSDGLIPEANLLGVVAKVERRGREISLAIGPGRSLIADMSRIGVLSVTARRVVRAFQRILGRRADG
jgi:signal peptidase I